MHTYNPGRQAVEARGQPSLCSSFKANRGYMRPYLYIGQIRCESGSVREGMLKGQYSSCPQVRLGCRIIGAFA